MQQLGSKERHFGQKKMKTTIETTTRQQQKCDKTQLRTFKRGGMTCWHIWIQPGEESKN